MATGCRAPHAAGHADVVRITGASLHVADDGPGLGIDEHEVFQRFCNLDIALTSHKVLSGFDYSRAFASRSTGFASDAHPFDIFAPGYGLLQLYDPSTGDLLPGLPIERRPDRA